MHNQQTLNPTKPENQKAPTIVNIVHSTIYPRNPIQIIKAIVVIQHPKSVNQHTGLPSEEQAMPSRPMQWTFSYLVAN